VSNRFASGRIAIAICDRCGQQFKLKELKTEIIKTKKYDLKVCKACWDPDHPQLQLGMYPVEDPQALRAPRRDTTYTQSGTGADGYPSGGSRQIQWGWNPVGMHSDFLETPNDLIAAGELGTVVVITS
jgi:hypothetical protein